MSYVALYRKWRPSTFEEVKGQDAVCTTLKNQIISGRIGHAYLFCGTRGTGKTSVAKIMAKAVNCANPVNGNPCGTCAMCRAVAEENSMNVLEIDAASNNGVDNIRDIREQVQYPPTEGKYRVYIIDEVHMLSVGAFNALLKTLEEPPEYVIFILATTEVHKIPVTVLSRCQRYDFRRITADVIADRLRELSSAEHIEIEDRALGYIARAADGAMRDALSLLDECVAFHPGEPISYEQVLEILGAVDIATFSGLFQALLGGKTGDALHLLEKAFTQGREMGQFVSDFLWYLRNLLILRTAEDADGIIDSSRENLQIMRRDAAAATQAQLGRYIRVFSELSNRMRWSSQKRVETELALIRLTSPEMETSNDALLERIASLEREIRNLKANGITVTASAAAKEAPAQAVKPAGPEVVELPKAKYEDFMELRENWGRIIEELGGTDRAALTGTQLEADRHGIIWIVFPDQGTMLFGGSDRTVAALTKQVREFLQKEFTFRVRLAKGGETARSYKVSEEDILNNIKYPVDRL